MTKQLATSSGNAVQAASPNSIEGMLKDQRYLQALSDASKGTGLTAERMVRILLTAVRQNTKLRECDQTSLFGTMVVSASLGLEPNTPLGHAHLIPFNVNTKLPNGQWAKKMVIQFIIGYQGLLLLVRRSKMVSSISAHCVREGDFFSYEYGSKQHLRHKPSDQPIEGRRITHVYAHAKLNVEGDSEQFEVMTYDECIRVRNGSQGYQQAVRNAKDGKEPNSPWIQHEEPMFCKTALRRLCKYLPQSAEMQLAQSVDAYGEHGIGDYSKFAGGMKEDAIIDLEVANANAYENPPELVEHQPEQEMPMANVSTPKKEPAPVKAAAVKQEPVAQQEPPQGMFPDDENAFFGE